MAINKKLIYYNRTLSQFQSDANGLNNQTTKDANGNVGNIPFASIVFTSDGYIWTHNKIFNGNNTSAVTSVNGKTGAVTLNLDDIADGSTRKLANYLPLSGGTLTGALTVPSLTVSGAATFSQAVNASILGNAATASRLQNARNIAISGAVTGNANFDGSGNITISTSVNHTHSYLPLSGGQMTGPLTWKDSAALPEQTSPLYFLVIDAFASGGTTKWSSVLNVQKALGIKDSSGNGVYLPLSGGTMTGSIKRFYSAASNDPMITFTSYNQDVWLWRINDGSSLSTAVSGVYGYGLKYLGTGSGNDNKLVLYSDAQSGTQVAAMSMQQDGTITLAVTPNVNGTNVSLVGHTHNYAGSSSAGGSATSAEKLTTVSKTAWGQTYWTSGGVPTSISGALSDVTTITSQASSRLDLMTHDASNSVTIGQANVPYIRLDTNHRVHIGNNVAANDATEQLQVEGYVLATGFKKSGSDANHLLLGNGGHKAISDFQVAGSYVTTNTAQTISGNKTFSGSTSIDDLTAGNLVVTGAASFAQTINGNIATADKVNNNLTIQLNGGSTEGTNKFTFNGSAAKSLNITPSAIGAKATQTAVSDPSASGTGISYIATISQNAQGVITATKSTVRSASTSQSGVVTTGEQSFAGFKTFSGANWGEQIKIYRSGGAGNAVIAYFNESDGRLGHIGVTGSADSIGKGKPAFTNSDGSRYELYHTGNLSPMTTSHAANGITSTKISNWDAVYTWYTTAAGTSASGVIDNWNEIKNFIDGFHESDDLAEYLVNTFVAKTGGTMTGALTVPSLTVTGASTFSQAINGSILGNAATASRLQNARTITLTGSVTGSGSFDGSGNLSIATTTNHNHNSSYMTASALFTGASSATSASVSLTNGNVYLNATKTINGSTTNVGSVKISGSGGVSVTTDANGHIGVAGTVFHLRAGANNGTANSTSATSDPYLLLVGGSTLDSQVQLKASTGISISANGGIVTITNTSTNSHTYTSTWTSKTDNNNYPIAFSPNATPATSGNGYNANFTFNPSTKTFNNNGSKQVYDSTNKVLKFIFD